MALLVLFSAAPDLKSAKKIAKVLIDKKCAACVTLQPGAISRYRWKNKVEESKEVLLTVKTESRLYGLVEKLILQNHPYDTPEILALPVKRSSKKYLKWAEESLE